MGIWGWMAAGIWLWRVVSGALAYRRVSRVRKQEPPPDAPMASILVPARNEEKNIAECLEALGGQEYPHYEVIAVDDNSVDRTGELIAAARQNDPKIISLEAPPTPEGWTGKNRALAAGRERARGEWLLFTDADARLGPHALSSAISHAEERRLDLLSLLPRAITGSVVERMLQPTAMGYLGWWFPFDRINNPDDLLAFANGQFLLMRREAYDALGGHAAVRGAYLEDVALARAAKQRGFRVECTLGKRLFGVRMYDSLERYLRGWHRIYLHAFDRRPGVLLRKAFEVAALSVIPLVFFLISLIAATSGGAWTLSSILYGVGLGLSVGLSYLFAGKVHSATGAHWLYAIFHPLAAAFLTGILLGSARAALTGAPTRWR